jgi:hypothetical protein
VLAALCSFFVCAGAIQGDSDFSGDWHEEFRPAHHVLVRWTLTRDCPQESVKGWEAYESVPPNLAYQTLQSAKLFVFDKEIANPMGYEASEAKVKILGVRVSPDEVGESTKLTVTAQFEATTYAQALLPGKPTQSVEPLNAHERAQALESNSEFDFKSLTFQKYLDDNHLRKLPAETELAFAHRIYEFVRKTMVYKVDAPFNDQSLSTDCGSLLGHCGNYSRRIIGIMRANGIPARISFGHWIVGGTHTYSDGRYHTRSEFYIDRIGWILADASEGIPPGGWKPERNLDCGFGNDDGGFLAFHVGSSLLVPTATWGPQRQEHLQNIYMPAIGGSWDKPNWTRSLSVQELPLN